MITILFYLLKVVLCSALLYTYYWFVLRNKQFHQYNRFFLMGISVLSWIAPLITIQIVKEQDIPSSKILHIANFISENNSLLEQEQVLNFIVKEQRNYSKPIVIENTFVLNFTDAEEYHQKYLYNNPTGYCHVNMNVLKEEEKKD